MAMPRDVIVLNDPSDGEETVPAACDAAEAAEALQRAALALESAFFVVGDEGGGGGVRYGRMPGSPELLDLVAAAQRLRSASADGLAALPETARRALFINVYNALTVHAIATTFASRGPGAAAIASVRDIPGFWSAFAYRIGPFALTLDDIEHGILRGNRPHPSSAFWRRGYWLEGDPRADLSVQIDPRIHFALVCGAKGCPRIRVYRSQNLEQGLAAAAAFFCASSVAVAEPAAPAASADVVGGARASVRCSQLLKWYGSDFGPTQVEALRRICSYMPPGSARERLGTLLDAAGDGGGGAVGAVMSVLQPSSWLKPGPVLIEYDDYDWALNVAD